MFNYVCFTHLKHANFSLLDVTPDCLLVALNSWTWGVGDISNIIKNNPRFPGLFFNRHVVKWLTNLCMYYFRVRPYGMGHTLTPYFNSVSAAICPQSLVLVTISMYIYMFLSCSIYCTVLKFGLQILLLDIHNPSLFWLPANLTVCLIQSNWWSSLLCPICTG